jgi:alpha-tubulin suppressor-like RCC1 family protein
VAVLGEHTFTNLATGQSHTCGVDNAGTAWCWGIGYFGELGDGINTASTTPVAVK